MATLIPTSNVEAAYEDMFKEITRKLYGEETGNGLHTLGTPVAQVATSGPTAPEGERSFTNLIDRSVAPTIEYEHNGGAVATGVNVVPSETSVVVATSGGNFKTEDQLSTAFGLAALMQNGFTTGGTILNTQAINKIPTTSNAGNVVVPTVDQQQQQQQQQQRWSSGSAASGGAEDIVQWSTGGKLASFNAGTPKSSGKSKNRHETGNPPELYTSPTGGNVGVVSNTGAGTSHQQTTPNSTSSVGNGGGGGGGNSRKKNSHGSSNASSNASNQQTVMQIQKRYACTHCPYSTDRRDLYTRHENIHKDEKPFQCYACLKQFNRADHVKKHFLRMHREMVYDINKTRRNIHCNNTSVNNNAATTASTSLGGGGLISSSISSAALQIDQKPNIFLQQPNAQQISDAFLVGQRQETASSLSIAQTIESVATASDAPLPQMKQEKCSSGDDMSTVVKIKREKRFTCCYCPWSGADKWGLKRHLNTHTKPFVCMLCDYKAARSERLATHVLKVHNKKACNKCSFLADNQEEYQTHLNEVHLLKMDALSRNTASVAQDFHKAGGVELKHQHQLTYTNLPSKLSKEAAFLHMNNNNGFGYRSKNMANGNFISSSHITSDDGNTSSSSSLSSSSSSRLSASSSPGKNGTTALDQRTAMSKFLSQNFGLQEITSKSMKNTATTTKQPSPTVKDLCNNNKRKINQLKEEEQLIKSPPAYSKNIKTTNNNNNNNTNKNNNNNLIHKNNNHYQQHDKRSEIQKLNGRSAMNRSSRASQSRQKQQQQQHHQHHQNRTHSTNSRGHHHDKENSNSIFSEMEYQNLSKFGVQFQNYVKDIINKYYSETPLLFPSSVPTVVQHHHQQQQPEHQKHHSSPQQTYQQSPKRQKILSETEEYIEYLKNKEDITLTITPKVKSNGTSLPQQQQQHNKFNKNHHAPAVVIKRQSPHTPEPTQKPAAPVLEISKRKTSQLATLLPMLADAAAAVEFESRQHYQDEQETITGPVDYSQKCGNNGNASRNRKQAQPKKIKTPPEVVVAMLRDKYLNRMVDRKKSCAICTNSAKKSMLVFPYHTSGSLALHHLWKHSERSQRCHHCNEKVSTRYSLKVHYRRKHAMPPRNRRSND